jgi:lipopolysaccharide transport system permease protein
VEAGRLPASHGFRKLGGSRTPGKQKPLFPDCRSSWYKGVATAIAQLKTRPTSWGHGMDATAIFSPDYFRRIWNLRHFWLSLVRNDIYTRYRGSTLGIGWSLARPVGMTIVFCVIFGNLFGVPVAEYAPFVLIGLTSWQFFTESILAGCQTFHTGAAYIRQQRIPLAIFPLRTVMGTAFHTSVALVMGLSVTWYFKGFGNLPVLWTLIPSLMLLFILGWCMAIVAGLANTHFPDTRHILELSLQFLFYLTPIIYRPNNLLRSSNFAWVVDCNPLWSVLELVRQPVLYGQYPPAFNIAVALTMVTGMALLAYVCLRKLERTLVFWL